MLISSYLSINALFDGYLKQHLKLLGIRKQRESKQGFEVTPGDRLLARLPPTNRGPRANRMGVLILAPDIN